MIDRARAVLERARLAETAQDSHWGIIHDAAFLSHINAGGPVDARDTMQTRSVLFWYRDAPVPLQRMAIIHENGIQTVQPFDPPLFYGGERRLLLDRDGRLIHLVAIPPPTRAGSSGTVNWPVLVEAAGLDIAAWTPADPQRTPPFFADTSYAWVPRDGSQSPLRVEASSFEGRPVTFQLVFPWTPPSRDTGSRRLIAQQVGDFLMLTLISAVTMAGMFIARRNVRLDRADRHGAVRLGGFAAALVLIIWAIDEHHVASIWEAMLFVLGAGWALFAGTLFVVYYLAFEPYVRRTWPRVIMSWSRVMAGKVRDPLVAGDVLIGCAAGVVSLIVELAAFLVARAATGALPRFFSSPRPFLGVMHIVSEIPNVVVSGLFTALTTLLVLFIARTLVRREAIAIVLCGVLVGVPQGLGVTASPWGIPFYLVAFAIAFTLLARVGLIAMVASTFVRDLLVIFPFTWPATAWYSGVGFVGIVLVAALAIAAFRIATAQHMQRPAVARAAPAV
jgi:serine/threonine-protein kinase